MTKINIKFYGNVQLYFIFTSNLCKSVVKMEKNRVFSCGPFGMKISGSMQLIPLLKNVLAFTVLNSNTGKDRFLRYDVFSLHLTQICLKSALRTSYSLSHFLVSDLKVLSQNSLSSEIHQNSRRTSTFTKTL